MGDTVVSQNKTCYEERFRWSVEACRKMEDIGFLSEKYELIDGEVINKMGQKPPHRIAILYFLRWLTSFLDVLQVQTEAPISVSDADKPYNGPEPDVAVTVQPTDFYRNRHPGGSDLLFVAEVADSSLKTDLSVKSLIYARADIPEYWVLDLTALQLHIHSNPINGIYTEITVYEENETVTMLTFPEWPVRVSELLPAAANQDEY